MHLPNNFDRFSRQRCNYCVLQSSTVVWMNWLCGFNCIFVKLHWMNQAINTFIVLAQHEWFLAFSSLFYTSSVETISDWTLFWSFQAQPCKKNRLKRVRSNPLWRRRQHQPPVLHLSAPPVQWALWALWVAFVAWSLRPPRPQPAC